MTALPAFRGLSAALILALLTTVTGGPPARLPSALPNGPDPIAPCPIPPPPAPSESEVTAYYSQPAGAVQLGGRDLRHPQATTLHFPTDGTTLVTGGPPGLRIWDLRSRKLLRQYPGDSYTGWPSVSTPDNQYFVSMGRDEVLVISRANGKPVRVLAVEGDAIRCFALSPNGRTVATGSLAGEIRLWDLETGRPKAFRAVHPLAQPITRPPAVPDPPCHPMIVSVAFSPDGTVVASSAYGDVLRGWDVQTGQEVWHFDRDTTCEGPFAFSPDGRFIAVPTTCPRPAVHPDSAGIAIYRVADQSLALELAGGGFAGSSFGSYAIAFSPDGRYLAAAGGDHLVRVWDARTGALWFAAPVSGASDVQFSRDGRTLAVVAGGVRLWDVETGADLLDEEGHTGTILDLDVSPDGSTVVTAGAEGTIRAWNATTGEPRWAVPVPRNGDGPVDVAIAPDGRSVAVAGFRGTVRVLDLTTGRVLRRLPVLTDTGYRINYSPDGKFLGLLGRNLTVHLCDAISGQVVGKLVGYDGHGCGWGSPFQFSPNGKTIVSLAWRSFGGGEEGAGRLIGFDPTLGPGAEPDGKPRLVLWDIASGRRLRILGSAMEYAPLAFAFAPDGVVLAVLDTTSVSIIDVQTGHERLRFPAKASSLAFAPDGRLWVGPRCHDPVTGKQLAEIPTGLHGLVAVSRNGSVLVTTDGDGCTAEVWKLPAR